MKLRLKFMFILTAIFYYSIAQAQNELNLAEALERVEQTPRLEQQRVAAQIVHTERKILWGALAPQLSFQHTIYHEEKDGGWPSDSEKTSKLTLVQPLLQGLKEVRTLKENTQNQLAANYEEKSTELELKVSMVDLFYQLAILDEDKKILEKQIHILREQAQALKTRIKLGKSRSSDLLANQAQSLKVGQQLNSDLQKCQEITTRLHGMLGANFTYLPPSVKEGSAQVSFDQLMKILAHHPEIKAIQAKLEAANQNVQALKNEHFPTLSLVSHYYLDRQETVLTKNRDWDIALEFELPLFSGLTTTHQIQAAALEKEQTSLQEKEIYWRLWGELKNLHTQYIHAQENAKLGGELAQVEEKNVELLKKETQLGLTNHLEVLTGMNQLLATQREAMSAQVGALSLGKQIELLISYSASSASSGSGP